MQPPFDTFAREMLVELTRTFPLSFSPGLVWSRFRTTAGVADVRNGLIRLSLTLMDSEERVEITLKHEYAHMLAVDRHGIKARGHGPHWRAAMADLGLDPEVHHRYDCKRNQARQRVEYRCEKCGAKLHRARRLPRFKRYVHVDCGGTLKLHEIIRQPNLTINP